MFSRLQIFSFPHSAIFEGVGALEWDGGRTADKLRIQAIVSDKT
jgi:hypothetical protein